MRIAPLDAAQALEPTVVRDLVYAGAAAADGIEHVRVRARPSCLDILAFVDSNDPQVAADVLRRLTAEVIGRTELLRLWRVI
ncbi:hypothetical protein [Actinoplanes nipponensis]|uniref:hypothetical protein n=1 Tax=Actinoplanes nipponensis TaxID=135950 RepID=UPI00194411B7|nr:hypothetical protein [Actinoplanes nipponensis]